MAPYNGNSRILLPKPLGDCEYRLAHLVELFVAHGAPGLSLRRTFKLQESQPEEIFEGLPLTLILLYSFNDRSTRHFYIAAELMVDQENYLSSNYGTSQKFGKDLE